MKKKPILIVLALSIINFIVYKYEIKSKMSNSYYLNFGDPVEPEYRQIDNFQFQFTKYFDNKEYSGKQFDKKWNRILSEYGLFNVSQTVDHSVLRSSPVAVTALSSSHFENGKSFLASFSKIYQKKILYIYDLGLL